MPELNPVTRNRLWYIAIFLAFDALISLYISATIPATDGLALPAIIFGLGSGVAAGAIISFLVATRQEEKNLRAQRSRE